MKLLSLTPSFSSSQDGPNFVLTLHNDTPKPVDLLELLGTSSIILGGKQYPNLVTKFVGNPYIAPNQTHSIIISSDAYLPDGERKAYSPVLKRWRWKTRLKSGRHTLFVRLGNAQIGPLEFVWDDRTPLLYR